MKRVTWLIALTTTLAGCIVAASPRLSSEQTDGGVEICEPDGGIPCSIVGDSCLWGEEPSGDPIPGTCLPVCGVADGGACVP